MAHDATVSCGAGRGFGEEEEEAMRVDREDGGAYPRSSFLEVYGDREGARRWNAAPVAGGPAACRLVVPAVLLAATMYSGDSMQLCAVLAFVACACSGGRHSSWQPLQWLSCRLGPRARPPVRHQLSAVACLLATWDV